MHRRYENINIPIELLRTLAAVSDTGSFAKGAELLGLTQSAISAQMKRLQIAVGGSLFEKTIGGVILSERGKLVRMHALRMLEANDRILAIGGSEQDPVPLRVGLSTLVAARFVKLICAEVPQIDCNIYADNSIEIAKGLVDGYVDIGLLLSLHNLELGGCQLAWTETFVWVRGAGLQISGEGMIPVVGWPGSLSDILMTHALEEAGLIYKLVFSSPDHSARLAAVIAGLGYIAIPSRFVDAP